MSACITGRGSLFAAASAISPRSSRSSGGMNASPTFLWISSAIRRLPENKPYSLGFQPQ